MSARGILGDDPAGPPSAACCLWSVVLLAVAGLVCLAGLWWAASAVLGLAIKVLGG